ncbi:MAG: glycosyltransferase [Bacteroidales bacterium]|nr:glycosyltransferase [Bacteroidales bacterium]
MNKKQAGKNKLVILTTLSFDQDSSASLSRIIEYTKGVTKSQFVTVYIASLSYANNDFISNQIIKDKKVYALGQNSKSKQNYFVSRYFRTKERKTEFKYILNQFLNDVQQTTFLFYSGSFATFWEEFYYIKKAKSLGFTVIAERNERSLGIVLNKLSPDGFLNKILFYCIQLFEVFNALIKDELSRFYDGNIVISTNFENWIKSRNSNYLKIPILANQELPSIKSRPIKITNIGYSGSFSFKKDGVDKLINAIEVLIHDYKISNIRLNISGFGTKRSIRIINKNIDNKGLRKHIIFFGKLNFNDYLKFQSEQDLMVVIRCNSLQGKYSFATKIAEYSKLGKLILTTNMSDNSLYIKDKRNGFLINKINPHSIAKCIFEVLKMPEEDLEIIRANAIQTSEKEFNITSYSDKLLHFLKLDY